MPKKTSPRDPDVRVVLTLVDPETHTVLDDCFTAVTVKKSQASKIRTAALQERFCGKIYGVRR